MEERLRQSLREVDRLAKMHKKYEKKISNKIFDLFEENKLPPVIGFSILVNMVEKMARVNPNLLKARIIAGKICKNASKEDMEKFDRLYDEANRK